MYEKGERDLHDNWPGQSVFFAIILAGISAAKGHMKEFWEAQQVLGIKRPVLLIASHNKAEFCLGNTNLRMEWKGKCSKFQISRFLESRNDHDCQQECQYQQQSWRE